MRFKLRFLGWSALACALTAPCLGIVSGNVVIIGKCKAPAADYIVKFTPPTSSSQAVVVTTTLDDGSFRAELRSLGNYYVEVLEGPRRVFGKVIEITDRPLEIQLRAADPNSMNCPAASNPPQGKGEPVEKPLQATISKAADRAMLQKDLRHVLEDTGEAHWTGDGFNEDCTDKRKFIAFNGCILGFEVTMDCHQPKGKKMIGSSTDYEVSVDLSDVSIKLATCCADSVGYGSKILSWPLVYPEGSTIINFASAPGFKSISYKESEYNYWTRKSTSSHTKTYGWNLYYENPQAAQAALSTLQSASKACKLLP